jgi:hypothetical protein
MVGESRKRKQGAAQQQRSAKQRAVAAIGTQQQAEETIYRGDSNVSYKRKSQQSKQKPRKLGRYGTDDDSPGDEFPD